MKTQFRRTAIALACALPLFAACQRDPAPASAPSDPAATSPSPSGPQTALGRTVESALNKALERTSIRKRLADLGIEPAPLGSDEAKRFVASEAALWGDVIRKAGIKLES